MKREQKLPPTVGELMEALRKLPPEVRVLARGYEDGWDAADLGGLVVRNFKPYSPAAPYYGDWEESRDGEPVSFKGVTL